MHISLSLLFLFIGSCMKSDKCPQVMSHESVSVGAEDYKSKCKKSVGVELDRSSTSAKKEGDFGIFNACITKNESLRLDCFYANCTGSPSFDCEFTTSNRTLLLKASKEMCRLILPHHRLSHANKTMTYNCTLTRNNRKEEKQVTIDYAERIKPCPATTGLLLHRAPALLWPVVTLSLWRVLVTDSQTT